MLPLNAWLARSRRPAPPHLPPPCPASSLAAARAPRPPLAPAAPHPPLSAAAPPATRRLIDRGLPTPYVRRLFHVLTSLGFALAVAPLALLASPSVPLATACLTAASALYACSFGGFHAYLQVGRWCRRGGRCRCGPAGGVGAARRRLPGPGLLGGQAP
jgi:hypothetical protein